VLVAALATLAPAGAAARSPSSLRCPSMPREQRVLPAVRPAVHAFFPWDRRGGENALRGGPGYPKPIALSGRRLGRRGSHTVLAFSTNGATHCTVSGVVVNCRTRLFREARTLRLPPGRRWRLVRTMLVIPRTGCFRIAVEGQGLRTTIPLAVPGPA